jgi:hypothetical protein
MSFLEAAARQMARDWIAPRVRNGQTPQDIAQDFCGKGGPGYSMQIHGFCFFQGRGYPIPHGHVGVFKVGGVECVYTFPIKELHREITHPDEVGQQISLF